MQHVACKACSCHHASNPTLTIFLSCANAPFVWASFLVETLSHTSDFRSLHGAPGQLAARSHSKSDSRACKSPETGAGCSFWRQHASEMHFHLRTAQGMMQLQPSRPNHLNQLGQALAQQQNMRHIPDIGTKAQALRPHLEMVHRGAAARTLAITRTHVPRPKPPLSHLPGIWLHHRRQHRHVGGAC